MLQRKLVLSVARIAFQVQAISTTMVLLHSAALSNISFVIFFLSLGMFTSYSKIKPYIAIRQIKNLLFLIAKKRLTYQSE